MASINSYLVPEAREPVQLVRFRSLFLNNLRKGCRILQPLTHRYRKADKYRKNIYQFMKKLENARAEAVEITP